MAANFYARRAPACAHNEMMHTPSHARRYLFVAAVELTDMRSDAKIQVRTSDLSIYGCRVETDKPLPVGTICPSKSKGDS